MNYKNNSDSSNPKNSHRPLKMSESIDTFIFSSEDMDLIIHEIGNNVRKYRMKCGLSIDKLAHLAGVTKGTLYKIEGGSANVGLVVLLKISYVLQVSLDNFVPFSFSGKEKRKSFGEIVDEISYGIPKETKLFILNFIKKFINYESTLNNKIRSKRMLSLPCEIGDTIWDNDFGYPCSYTVTGFDIGTAQDQKEKHEELYVYCENKDMSIVGHFPVSIIGKEVFLSHKEAENALEREKSCS